MSRYAGMAAWTLVGGTLARYEGEKYPAIRYMAPMREAFQRVDEPLLPVRTSFPTFCLGAHEFMWPSLDGWEHVVIYAESKDEIREHFAWPCMACRLLEWVLE